VMRDTPRWPAVMFISIERCSGDLLGLMADELERDEELAKDEELSRAFAELSASGTLCLGVFHRPGLHENLGSVDKVDVNEFIKRATAIFRERTGFTGEIVRLDNGDNLPPHK